MPVILAIDDRQDNLISLSALLKSMIPDCQVETALSGSQGIEKAKIHKPDTIILDINMPIMDGFEVCHILKADPVTKHIPVIMLTAVSTDSESRVKGLELGADAFLTKPVDRFELAAQVKVMLRIKSAEDLLRLERDNLKDTVRETYHALEEREQFMRMAMEGTGEGTWDWDLVSGSIVLNDEWQKILGYESGEAVFDFDWWNNSVHPDSRPVAEKALKAYLKGDVKYYELEYQIKTKAGKWKWIWARGICVSYDEAGQPLRMIGTLRDITDIRKEAQERKLLAAQLRQAQKMEALGTLAGGIAHDFNNILFPIIGFTEMMLETAPEGSELLDSLNEVLSSSLRASDLVQQILAFSRQAEKELKPLKIQKIIRDVLKLMRASLPSTITIDQQIDDACGKVLTDPTHIHQIAMNLITNAFHAMGEEGGTLGILLSEVIIGVEDLKGFDLKPGRFVRFSVSDTGPGIDRFVLERIFEPYFTTKDKEKGTGLGLSVVHGIVKSYKGDIRVYSEPGSGAVFNVYLPVTDLEQDLTTPLNGETHLAQGGNEHVMVVDDEDSILRMEKQMLERLGYQVTTQTGSLEALETFRLSPDSFDLVITDMTMPVMTGEKLAIELKKIRKEIPVILCTGFCETMTKEKTEAMGLDGFLMKPITKNDLSQNIRLVLDEKQTE